MSTGTIRALRLLGVRSASTTRAELSRPDAAATRAVTALLATRVLVWLSGLGALALFGANQVFMGYLDPQGLESPFSSTLANHLYAPAARWDGVWYLGIAHTGYFSHQATAFFPLYPLLVHAGGALFGSELVAGVFISVAAMVGAGYLLFLLTRADLGEAAARTTVALLAFFPTSLFLSAVYTESLFLLVSVGALYAARRERWAVAGALGALASATRSTGLLLLIPLAIMYLYGPRDGAVPLSEGRRWAAVVGRVPGRWWRPRYAPARSLWWIALVPAGIVAYIVYLATTHGAPLAPFQAESYWGRAFAGPFGAVAVAVLRLPGAVMRVLHGTQHGIGPGAPLGWEAYQLIDIPFLIFTVAGLWLCVRRLPRAYAAYALVLVCESLSYPTHVEPLESSSRYLLVVFPIFMAWGAYLSSRRWTRRAALAVSAVGLIAFSALWGTWAWVA